MWKLGRNVLNFALEEFDGDTDENLSDQRFFETFWFCYETFSELKSVFLIPNIFFLIRSYPTGFLKSNKCVPV